MMSSNIDVIKSLCKLVSNTFDLATLFIEPNGNVAFECINNQVLNPLYKNEKQNLFNTMQFNPNEQSSFPVIRKTLLSENYILISIFLNDDFNGTVLIGPSKPHEFSKIELNGLINDVQGFFSREQVFNYYKVIPTFTYEKLIDIGIMAFKLFNGILLPIGKVLSKNNELIQTVEINKKVISIASKNLQSGVLHHDPLLEKEIFNIIKEGRVEDLKDFSILRDEESVGILSKSSYIRSLKNNIIVLITLVTRSSIEGGLHPEFAFALSDTFIQQLEELNNFNEIKELAQEVRYTFTYKVSQIKKNRYSKTITLCQNYIFTNIYENINHNDIAEMIGLSPQHLSSLFKKEVGISLSEFRQQEQVNEAKKLILYSNTPFSEVSALLNFSDQSYFTKVFKKHVGITPKQYKERSYLLEE